MGLVLLRLVDHALVVLVGLGNWTRYAILSGRPSAEVGGLATRTTEREMLVFTRGRFLADRAEIGRFGHVG
jgi:hypothetical protein